MKSEDFGINPETGSHSRQHTDAETDLLDILSLHIGKEDRISANDLAVQFHEEQEGRRMTHAEYQQGINQWKRGIRYLVNHLVIDHDEPIMSKAGSRGGYYIAQNKDEVNEFYDTFRKRAMTGLIKASRGKRSIMAKMVKQIAFEFDELKSARPARAAKIKPIAAEPAPVIVMAEFLDEITKHPEKYSDAIKLLRQKFAHVLMPKDMYAHLTALSAELSKLLRKIR